MPTARSGPALSPPAVAVPGPALPKRLPGRMIASMPDAAGAKDSGIRLGSVGPYLIERELRRGGMGTVYLARDDAGRPYALKMSLRDDPQSAARFAREIRATRSLRHPGIVRVHDDGEWHGRVWYVMDYVSEVNLADVLTVHGPGAPDDLGGLVQAVLGGQVPRLAESERRGLAQPTALAVMRRVVDAVVHAHARGVLHRDLKPSNILLTLRGDPVLADFGVARDLAVGTRLTGDHEVVGTFTYIAPEQLAGEEIDERADIYALGAMLFECLVGHPPPRRRDGCERLRFSGSVAPELRRIVYQALEPDPEHRVRSAAVLAGDLRRFERGEPVLARAPGLRRIALFQLQRHLLLSSLAAALLGVAVLLVVVLLSLEQDRVDRWSPLAQEGATGSELVAWRDERPSARTIGRIELPPARGVRVSAELPLVGAAPAVVFLAASERWDDGYRMALHPGDPALGELLRGEDLLWTGPVLIDAEASVTVVLERLGGRIRVEIAGREVIVLDDPLPLVGGFAGAVGGAGVDGTLRLDAPAVASVPLGRTLPRDWLATRTAVAAGALAPSARRQLLELAAAELEDLLRRSGPDDGRRPGWLLRLGAVRAAAEGVLDDEHGLRLEAHAEVLAGDPAYHRQLLLVAASSLGHDRLRQQIEEAAYHLERAELELLACWAERALAGEARETVLERLLPRLAGNRPLLDHLHRRLVRPLPEADGDPAMGPGEARR